MKLLRNKLQIIMIWMQIIVTVNL